MQADDIQPKKPWRTKYNSKVARNYQLHAEPKDRAERRLVSRAFEAIPLGTVLDIPCGGGRMSLLLANKGYTVAAADYSEAMVEIARENAQIAGLPIAVVRHDIEQLDVPDGSFDTVLSFRLFHHFPTPDIRARVVTQLCRVARRRVVISYFSSWAATSLKRSIQSRWFGYRQKKFSVGRTELAAHFRANDFEFRKNFARMPLLHTLHVAVFERVKSDLGDEAVIIA